ncbi:hypothetical protein EVAR_20598_1 [Eumeta japonica]|uniref:Secreted protein n=1 Tax=Eumeta variegata TaxID=151549 RepID=A0A4C1US04_EUMVA|nr:hypothetical protein EVAR_20598_1 [Eumeta japonica]
MRGGAIFGFLGLVLAVDFSSFVPSPEYDGRPVQTRSERDSLELQVPFWGCGWESLMKNVTLGNVTMSHRTRERPAECLASLSHSTMIGLPRAQH